MSVQITQALTNIVRVVRDAMGDTETTFVGPFVTSEEADAWAAWKELDEPRTECYVETLFTVTPNGYAPTN